MKKRRIPTLIATAVLALSCGGHSERSSDAQATDGGAGGQSGSNTGATAGQSGSNTDATAGSNTNATAGANTSGGAGGLNPSQCADCCVGGITVRNPQASISVPVRWLPSADEIAQQTPLGRFEVCRGTECFSGPLVFQQPNQPWNVGYALNKSSTTATVELILLLSDSFWNGCSVSSCAPVDAILQLSWVITSLSRVSNDTYRIDYFPPNDGPAVTIFDEQVNYAYGTQITCTQNYYASITLNQRVELSNGGDSGAGGEGGGNGQAGAPDLNVAGAGGTH